MNESKKIDEDVQQRILTAAREEFFAKGYDGARMQRIADVAKINKAMLHYYYGNKETLFMEVFTKAFGDFMPKIMEIMSSDISFFDKIREIMATHTAILQKNPGLPLFINSELQRGNVKMAEVLPFSGKLGLRTRFAQLVEEEMAKGNIKPIDPLKLFVNILSLTIFPFIARPVMMLSLNVDPMTFEWMMEKRKTEIAEFVIDAIKNNHE